MKAKLATFLKGTLMGICDTIPGISGGTIAFITGIYEKLINSIKNITPEFFYQTASAIKNKNKTKIKQNLNRINLNFLVVLLSGILLGIILFSRAINFLLENYLSYTLAFFVGIILASSKIIFDKIEKHHTLNVSFSIIGLTIGILLTFLHITINSPTNIYIFLGGFFAISAMILPGISGSFILLIMGIYKFMLETIRNPLNNLSQILTFILGAFIGLFTITRIISHFLKKDKSKTLYVLLGFLLGSIAIPIKQILQNTAETETIVLITIFLLGILIVYLIKKLEDK